MTLPCTLFSQAREGSWIVLDYFRSNVCFPPCYSPSIDVFFHPCDQHAYSLVAVPPITFGMSCFLPHAPPKFPGWMVLPPLDGFFGSGGGFISLPALFSSTSTGLLQVALLLSNPHPRRALPPFVPFFSPWRTFFFPDWQVAFRRTSDGG